MDLFKLVLKDIKNTLIDFQMKNFIFQTNLPSTKPEPLSISSYREKLRLEKYNFENYSEFFMKLVAEKHYFCQLNDLSIISGYYNFPPKNNSITDASLQFFPNPGLEKEKDFADDIIEDILETNREKKNPLSDYLSNYIRIDFNSSTDSYREIYHPCSHIHIGFQSDYRISVDKFPYFSEFFKMILFYIYPDLWKNLINKRTAKDNIEEINKNEYKRKRKKDIKNNFIKSNLTDIEKYHYLFEL